MIVDFCFSLGGSCSSAIQLKRRGLRAASLPFDWVLQGREDVFAAALEVVRNGGEGWLAFENLERLAKCHAGAGLGKFQYRDRATGFEFLHDFHCDVLAEENRRFYDDVVEVYRRRFARLTDWLSSAETVLLVLDSDSKFSTDDLLKLKSGWEAAFPSVRFSLFAVLFGQEAEEVAEAEDLTVRRVWRRKHRYDNDETAPEWDFLDEVSLSGRFKGEGAPAGTTRRMPLLCRALRVMFLASRKFLRQAGWLASVE